MRESNAIVMNNSFYHAGAGLYCHDANPMGTLLCSDNHFLSTGVAAQLTNYTGLSKIDILDNVIHNPTFAFKIENSSFQDSEPPAKLVDNIIDNSVSAGIFIEDSEFWLIRNNIVSQFKGGGIVMKDAHNNQVRENQITGLNMISAGHGIQIENSNENFLCCNDIDNTSFGLQIIGESPMPNGIARTHFGSHFYALNYDAIGGANPVVPRTGPQFLVGNQWNTIATLYDAFFEGTDAESVQSRYTVQSLPPGNIDPIIWFQQFGTENSECSGVGQEVEDCGTTIWSFTHTTEFDNIVVAEELVEGGYYEAVTWMEEFRLFKKLSHHPELIEGDFFNFYNNNMNLDIGKLSSFESSFKSVQQISVVNQENLQEIMSIFEEVRSLNSQILLDEQNGGSDSTDLIHAKIDLIKSARPKIAQYKNELLSGNEQRKQAYSELYYGLVNDSYSTIYALTLKSVYLIYLDYLINESLPTQSLNDLLSIGLDCPFILGPAVYTARSLYDDIAQNTTDWPGLVDCPEDRSQPLRKASPQVDDVLISLFQTQVPTTYRFI